MDNLLQEFAHVVIVVADIVLPRKPLVAILQPRDQRSFGRLIGGNGLELNVSGGGTSPSIQESKRVSRLWWAD